MCDNVFMKKAIKRKMTYCLFLSFIFTVSSFCFGGVFAHAEADIHEHEYFHAVDEKGVHLSQTEEKCCDHEQGEMSDVSLSLHRDKAIPFLYLFIAGDFFSGFKNDLADYIHTTSLSPPPEKIALSSVVKRE